MKNYLLTAAAVIFFSIIVSLIIPEGKLNKTITFVMRLVCISVLIQPLSGIFEIKNSANVEGADYAVIAEVYSNGQSRELKRKIYSDLGIEAGADVIIEYDGENFAEKGVIITLDKKNEIKYEEIYEYLVELGYINITITTVYAESN